MFRWLVLGLLAWLIYRLWRQFQTAAKTPAQPEISNQTAPVEAIVKCAHCELHVPQQQAVLYNGQSFCCLQHKDAHYPS